MNAKPKNCHVCGEHAEIYGEGVAKAIYDECGNKITTYFVDFDGYAVRCSNCFVETVFFNTIPEAIEAWNNNDTVDDAIDLILGEDRL